MTTKTFDIDAEDAQLILDQVDATDLRGSTRATLIGVSNMDEVVPVEMSPREILAVRDGVGVERNIEEGSYSHAVELFGSFHDVVVELLEE